MKINRKGTRRSHENKQKVILEGKKVFVVKLLESNTTLRSEHSFYERLCGQWQDYVLSIGSPA